MKRLRKTIGLLMLGLLLTNVQGLIAQDTITTEEKKELRKTERAAQKAQIDAMRAEIDNIKANATLSEEEKGDLIKAKREEIRGLRGNRKKGKRGRGHKEANEEVRAQIKSIKEDANLSEEEKKAQIKAIREEARPNRAESSGRKGKKGKGIKKAERAAKKGNLDKAQIDRAMKGLERAEKSLSKQYDKGKISEEVYNTRLAKINEVRAKLIP